MGWALPETVEVHVEGMVHLPLLENSVTELKDLDDSGQEGLTVTAEDFVGPPSRTYIQKGLKSMSTDLKLNL